MFNYTTIKHILLLCSDVYEDHSNSSFTFRLFHVYSRISNMNIGTWPLEHEELTNSHVKCREVTVNENNQLFWTKAFLQTSSYDEKRYRQISSNACDRIVQQESKKSPCRSTLSRPSSVIAVSLSETSTRQTSSNNNSISRTKTLPITTRKKSSSTRFSCYLKSHNTKTRSKPIKKTLPKNNNHYHDKIKIFSPQKSLMKFPNEFHITKNEENELRKIIEIVIEEFQDHFGQALNLSIKQMTQHLFSNINLFYHHYQKEFEQLTKKYRLTFLQRFIQLMKKFQIYQTKTKKFIQKTQPIISITNPPDILSMSSLSESLTIDKDRSETIPHLTTPSDSISLSTTSNPSIIIGEKTNRKYFPIQNSSSKKTFILNKTNQRKPTSLSSQLIDAYRFRDTLRINDSYFSSPRPKLR